MDSSASVGVEFVLLRLITSLFLFLVSSTYADNFSALQSPTDFCSSQGRITVCQLPVEYPLEIPDYSDRNCGYPGFKVDCDPNKYEGKPFMNISNHIYHVRYIHYKFNAITLVDIDVEGSGGCPQPKQNFSFPSSPSWVNYDLSTNEGNITIFYNCSSVPANEEYNLLCSKQDTNTPPSYALYDFESKKGFDWDAIKGGFYMTWSATDWCEDCERSGGHCWFIYNSTGCACGKGTSYDRTCPVLTPPTHQGVPPTPSTASKSQHRKDGLSTGLKIGIGGRPHT